MMRWVAGTLLGIVMVVGGYTYRATDERTFANQARIERNVQDIARLDTDLQQEKVKNDVKWHEVERRLANIELALQRIEDRLQRGR